MIYESFEETGASSLSGGLGGRTQRVVNLTGAAVSLALVVGMGIWGYKLLVRDVSGVPVIEALEGAFRTEPENPGGMQAPHQGLEVNEIAAVGSAGGPAEEVRLAPDPETPSSEDAPWGDLIELQPAATGPDGNPDTLSPGGLRSETEISGNGRVVDAQPEGALATDLAVAEAMSALAGAGESRRSLETSTGSLMVPRPLPRPEDEPIEAAARSGETASVGAGEVDVADLSKGTRLVQLGAFENVSAARRSWSEIGARFGDSFEDKRMVLQQATSGGREFYRLRAEGFTDLADARRFCSQLLAAETDCIPVEVR